MKHLLRESYHPTFLRQDEFEMKYKISTPIPQFYGLLSSDNYLKMQINQQKRLLKQTNKSLNRKRFLATAQLRNFVKQL